MRRVGPSPFDSMKRRSTVVTFVPDMKGQAPKPLAFAGGFSMKVVCLWYAWLIEKLSLRFDGETDDDFRERAERTARIVRVLVSACLRNRCVQKYIADPSIPQWSVESVLRNPTVR